MGSILTKQPTHEDPDAVATTANKSRIPSPWPDLPAEMLEEVHQRLSPADRIRSGAVCTNWLKSIKQYEIQAMPWLVSYKIESKITNGPVVCLCKLFDPMHQRPYSVHEICSNQGGFSKSHTSVRGLDHGWLIFSWESTTGNVTSFLLFSPFTKETISLPDLEYILDDEYYLPILSSDPSSPECAIYVLYVDLISRRFIINTCKNGDSKWAASVFRAIPHRIYGAVYYEGCLYCIHKHGNVNVYDTNRIVASNLQPPIDARSWENSRFVLIVCEGKLLFVHWDREKERDLFHVFEFRKSGGTWFEKQSLGDQALLLSCPSFSVSEFGSTSNMANRIYYKSYNRITKSNELKYFSLKDRECYRCPESIYSRFWLEEGIWVQPPRFHTKGWPFGRY